MAKLDLLQDGFVGATIDTAIWTANYVGGAMTLTQNNVGIVTLTAAANYSAFYNSTAYDLTDSYAFIETTTVPNQSTNAEAFLKLEEDFDNYFIIALENGTLYFREVVAGTPTTLSSVSWNATTHKWWRIRESSGTVYYDTSEDGIVWTNRTSVVYTVDATAVKPSIGAGTYQTETSPGTFQFDKFNIQPLTPTSINSTVVNEVFLVIPRQSATNYTGEIKPTTNYDPTTKQTTSYIIPD